MAGRGRFIAMGVGVVGLLIGVVAWLARSPGPGPVALDPNPTQQGGQVRVSGRGFYPLEPISLQISRQTVEGDLVPLQETRATLGGAISAAYVAVPSDLPSGQHRFEVVGQISGRRVATILWVRSRAPWMTLSTSQTKPREKLGLIVGGFAAGEQIRFSLTPRASSSATSSPTAASARAAPGFAVASTDQVGNSSWLEVTVPRVAPGPYHLVARGLASGQEITRDLDIGAYQPTVELSPWAGPPGIKLQLNVRGFEPGETVVVFLGGDAHPAASLVADRYGNLWGAGPVRVPFGTLAGTLNVRLVGQDSGAQTTASFRVLSPRPWLELTQYWGAPGGSVELSGGGWAADERIAIHLGSAQGPTVAHGQADDYGWLHDAGPAIIPLDATYSVTFVAVGEASHSQATATFKIVLPFGLRPDGTTLPIPTPASGGLP